MKDHSKRCFMCLAESLDGEKWPGRSAENHMLEIKQSMSLSNGSEEVYTSPNTAPQSADGTGKKNPEPDQETLCGDGFAVNRQRILTIAATRVVVRKVAAVRLAHGERAII